MTRPIGKYNVSINSGNLDHATQTWYYGIQIDKFDEKDKWKGSNFLYVKGHKDGFNSRIGELYMWLENVTESEIDFLYEQKMNTKFALKEIKYVLEEIS